jgi:Secretion system C-terminal sorting domain/GEVED domain
LNSYIGQTIYIAFKSNTTAQYHLYLDDISVDGIPTGFPSCAQNLIATPNANCGNLKTILSWAIDPNATGYNLSIGTTTGGTDILNNQSIGYVGTYDVINQVAATTYYWTLTPYNLNGSALGCTPSNYVTYFASCYCSPNPTAVDGYGITNVTIGDINNTTQIDPGNYGNFSVLSTSVTQGASIPFSVKMQTAGYPYNIDIWIDWNDDYDFFDANENAFVGLSTTASINFVTGSISIPNNTIVGPHRMRFSGQFTSPTTPCFIGGFACFEDYTINVTPNLATSSFENSKFSVYPNPVKDILNLKSNTEITNIEVYNLLGQKVLIKAINTSQIDMTNLASGTYLIKFESDKNQEILKVIKQ